jgi:fructose-bisphosphate aldolase class II
VAKINYYTGLSDAACRRIKENISASKQNEQSTLLTGVRDAVRMEAERCLGIWGCSGRAAEVLGQCRPWQALDLAVLSAA